MVVTARNMMKAKNPPGFF
jgi:hypothetical protein